MRTISLRSFIYIAYTDEMKRLKSGNLVVFSSRGSDKPKDVYDKNFKRVVVEYTFRQQKYFDMSSKNNFLLFSRTSTGLVLRMITRKSHLDYRQLQIF